MDESRRVGLGVGVLAAVVVAFVAVLVWAPWNDEPRKGGDEGAAAQQKAAPAAAPANGPRARGDVAEDPAPPPAAGGSLHDRVGGREAFHAMTGKLLEAVQKNQVVMANERVMEVAKRVNVRDLHQRFTDYLCKEAGGPCTYTGRPMKDYLAQLQLTRAQWDALTADFAAVLVDMQLPENEARELQTLVDALADGVIAD